MSSTKSTSAYRGDSDLNAPDSSVGTQRTLLVYKKKQIFNCNVLKKRA